MKGTFGYKVRKLRLDREWSQHELSIHAGVSTPHISSLERGKRSPSLDYAQRMANALGVPVQSLCDESADLELPKLRGSNQSLPIHLQNFVLNEACTPYLNVAHRLSYLPKQDSEFLSLMVDLLAERRREAK